MNQLGTLILAARADLVGARLPFHERMEVLLEWLGWVLLTVAVLAFLIYRWARGHRSLKHASRRGLHRMYARGEITLAEYERERMRRRDERDS